jgi:regulator of protease activity HflC (stomatin/prohibitin superfamily)
MKELQTDDSDNVQVDDTLLWIVNQLEEVYYYIPDDKSDLESDI